MLYVFQLYVLAHTEEMHTDLYISEDGGDTFEEAKRLPFMLGRDLVFHPSDDSSKFNYVMANCSMSGVSCNCLIIIMIKTLVKEVHGSHVDWKTWEKGKTFSSQGKSQRILNRLEKSRNFTQNTGKVREIYPKYWKSEGIGVSFYFYFSSDFLIELYLLNHFFTC